VWGSAAEGAAVYPPEAAPANGVAAG